MVSIQNKIGTRWYTVPPNGIAAEKNTFELIAADAGTDNIHLDLIVAGARTGVVCSLEGAAWQIK